MIDRVPEELWMEVHDIVQEAVIEIIPKIKKCKKAEWLSEEAFQISVRNICISYMRKEENVKAKEKYSYKCRVPKNSKER